MILLRCFTDTHLGNSFPLLANHRHSTSTRLPASPSLFSAAPLDSSHHVTFANRLVAFQRPALPMRIHSLPYSAMPLRFDSMLCFSLASQVFALPVLVKSSLHSAMPSPCKTSHRLCSSSLRFTLPMHVISSPIYTLPSQVVSSPCLCLSLPIVPLPCRSSSSPFRTILSTSFATPVRSATNSATPLHSSDRPSS